MKKQKQFEMAKKLRDGGLSLEGIGEVVAAMAKRKKPYATSTMSAWLLHDTYDDYSEANRKAVARVNSKEAIEVDDPRKAMVEMPPDNTQERLESIEDQLRAINEALKTLLTAMINIHERLK